MQEQNYKNHIRMVTGFHYVLFGTLFITLIASIIHLYQAFQLNDGLLGASVLVLLTLGIILAAFYGRSFAIKAQDRAIRAEENFRYFILTGKPLDSALRLGQIIALRFASDSEVIELSKKAIAENLTAKAIKQEIKNWKADNHRV